MKKTFFDLYDRERSAADLKFVRSFWKLWPLFNSKEKRIRHMARYWGCWLRHHRFVRTTNNYYYIFLIMNSRGRETIAFDYLNQKDKG